MKRTRPLARNYEHVYRALRADGGPMTAYEVLDAVRTKGISAPPTVYRALSRLVDQGLAHRLESINAYIACSDPEHAEGATVFAICEECGLIEEIADEAVLKRLQKRAEERGFHIDRTTVELRGRCAACLAAAPS